MIQPDGHRSIFHFMTFPSSHAQNGDYFSSAAQNAAGEPDHSGVTTKRWQLGTKAEAEMPGSRGSAMALVQYQQITGNGLGTALRPLLRSGSELSC